MPSQTLSLRSHHRPVELYALVADVARYPEFLPWCRAARILDAPAPTPELFHAELVIHFKGWTEGYVSEVRCTPPASDSEGRIDVTMVRGPFAHLTNHWRFTPLPDGTQIECKVDFAFRSHLLEKLVGSLFARASAKMVEAFETRADALYG